MVEITTELAEEISEVARLLDDAIDQQAVLERLVLLAVRIVPGTTAAAITVTGPSRPETLAVSAPELLACHDAQFHDDDGPAADALRHGEPRRIDDMRAESRWPRFRERARAAGYLSCLALPLRTEADPVAALNLYANPPGTFVGVAHDLGLLFAAQSGTALHNAELYLASVQLVDNLHRALRLRALVEQAKGMLMEREGYRAEQAMAVLRRASQQANVKVVDLAREFIAGRVSPTTLDAQPRS